jgi:hypothetical protein
MPIAPQHDATPYAAQLAQWWDAQAAAAKQWTPFEIGACIVAGLVVLAIVGLWGRSIQHKTLLTSAGPLSRPSNQITNQLNALLKGQQMASQNLAAITTSIGSLATAVGQLLTAYATQGGDDAALPALQATIDGLTGQINAALNPTPTPAVGVGAGTTGTTGGTTITEPPRAA